MPGLRDLEENIERLQKANDETRAIIREAHEVIQTAKLVLKELQVEHDRWADGVKKEVDAALERQVAAGLEEYANALQTATENAHIHVTQEFDKLKNVLLYGNERGRGNSLVTDWVRKVVQEELILIRKKNL